MLKFKWEVEYKNGGGFNQYEDNKENLYGDIERDKIKEFKLVGENDEFKIVIGNGEIWANGEKLVEGCKGDLIYFRRVKVSLNKNVKTLGSNVIFHLGIGDKKLLISGDGKYEKEGF